MSRHTTEKRTRVTLSQGEPQELVFVQANNGARPIKHMEGGIQRPLRPRGGESQELCKLAEALNNNGSLTHLRGTLKCLGRSSVLRPGIPRLEERLEDLNQPGVAYDIVVFPVEAVKRNTRNLGDTLPLGMRNHVVTQTMEHGDVLHVPRNLPNSVDCRELVRLQGPVQKRRQAADEAPGKPPDKRGSDVGHRQERCLEDKPMREASDVQERGAAYGMDATQGIHTGAAVADEGGYEIYGNSRAQAVPPEYDVIVFGLQSLPNRQGIGQTALLVWPPAVGLAKTGVIENHDVTGEGLCGQELVEQDTVVDRHVPGVAVEVDDSAVPGSGPRDPPASDGAHRALCCERLHTCQATESDKGPIQSAEEVRHRPSPACGWSFWSCPAERRPIKPLREHNQGLCPRGKK
mmetsp:Transcript_69521/g.193431  ORF Transcript_69521/g.193431 Transcript_69521/m.193431 type:complete len:405 (+) Transcript_69521:69-1283(+)